MSVAARSAPGAVGGIGERRRIEWPAPSAGVGSGLRPSMSRIAGQRQAPPRRGGRPPRAALRCIRTPPFPLRGARPPTRRAAAHRIRIHRLSAMYRHFLVPVDDTDAGIDTVAYALEFARSIGARITFVQTRIEFEAADAARRIGEAERKEQTQRTDDAGKSGECGRSDESVRPAPTPDAAAR
ncbi:hypothetical protein ACRTBV_26660, partial [Burkholderia pseudomallei]